MTSGEMAEFLSKMQGRRADPEDGLACAVIDEVDFASNFYITLNWMIAELEKMWTGSAEWAYSAASSAA